MTGVDALAEVAPTIPKPIHGGAGDGALHIIQGTPLGQKGKDEPALVRQDVFDVSDGNVRYDFAPQTEFFNTATGAVERKQEYETITFVTPSGVLALEPSGGWVSDVMTPDAFTRETAKTNGILSRDMLKKHTLREGNPLTTAMAKEALLKTIDMLGAATPTPEGTATMGILEERRHALEAKLKSMQ